MSRSLAACEGAILVVDAAQGVEAQTLANVYLALDNNLEIVPVLNKIDLPGGRARARQAARSRRSSASTPREAVLASAKQGIGIDEMLEAVVAHRPAAEGRPDARRSRR